MSAEEKAEQAIDHAIGEYVNEIGPQRMEELLQVRAQDMRELQQTEDSLDGSAKVDRLEGDAENLDVDDDVKRTNAPVLDPEDLDDDEPLEA